MSRKQENAPLAPPMNNGFSGGFFLPAQRSMHCKGGFFTQDPFVKTAPPTKPSKAPPEVNRQPSTRTPKAQTPTPQSTNKRSKPPPSSTIDPRVETNVNAKFELAMKELNDIKDEYQRARPQTSIQDDPAPSKAAKVQEETNIPIAPEHSPNKKLKIAEMVIRKLYKKNLELEKALEKARKESNQSSTTFQPILENPPTLESLQQIGTQKEEYLKHLATEQDKTIQELKLKIASLESNLPDGLKQDKQNKNAVISKLQKRLQEAIGESTRQKESYIKLKNDYKRLLLQRTATISSNSDIDSHARELLSLMERRLKKVEDEREQELTLYNMKLFETEQQNCDEYVAKKMLEQEMNKVAKEIKEREEIDSKMEKCMFGVFDRLHQVEQENIKLRELYSKVTTKQAE